MRYGIIRDASFLPPPAEQRALLEALDCDLIIQERGATHEGAHRISRLLYGVKRGDQVVVQSLVVFLRTTGEVVQTVRNLLELGASITVAASPNEIITIEPDEGIIQALSLLSDHESRRPSQPASRARGRIGGGSRNPLSPYQVDYARKLHTDGASLRSIGMLFQLAPDEVWRLIGR